MGDAAISKKAGDCNWWADDCNLKLAALVVFGVTPTPWKRWLRKTKVKSRLKCC